VIAETKRIMIVDDDPDIREVLEMLFRNDGYETVAMSNGRAAIESLESAESIDLIVSDMKMPGIDGRGIQDYLIRSGRSVPIVFITAFGTVQDAVDAMKKGAIDFITKPFNKDVMRHVVHRMLSGADRAAPSRPPDRGNPLIHRSASMAAIMETIKKVAASKAPVLIQGKSGSGKEMVASALHSFAPDSPFVKVNCAALPPSLMESELFGYRKGAFTGATANYMGKAKASDGGTLFLDEIGDMPLELQPKLLRLLEEKKFDPLGSNSSVSIDARIVCATNRDLRRLVESGLFREDLYYRINTITIRVPDLSERRDDIMPLARFFVEKYSLENQVAPKLISDEAEKALLSYSWPGNVRELRNAIERAILLSEGPTIGLEDIPLEMSAGGQEENGDSPNRISAAEKRLISEALAESVGNVTLAARKLGITRDMLRYKIKKYSLHIG
jgi:DNA-binding NtrC family response regulator